MGKPVRDLLHAIGDRRLRMDTSARVYEEKREFIEKLNYILPSFKTVKRVEYRYFEDLWSEYIKITWKAGGYQYIAVTGDSLSCMLQEIATVLGGGKPVGFIPSLRQTELIDKWWEQHS